MVDAKDTNEMTRLLAIMNNASTTPSTAATSSSSLNQSSASSGDPGVKQMKSILEKFYAATNNAAVALTEDARNDDTIREALVTKRTSRGAQIGSWEIILTESDKTKTYCVRNVHSGENIATDLRLYEAAHALVKLFNRGVGINTVMVREVLDLEAGFCKHRYDALVFKRSLNRLMESGDKFRRGIAETRYEDAKAKALAAREKVRKLFEGL